MSRIQDNHEQERDPYWKRARELLLLARSESAAIAPLRKSPHVSAVVTPLRSRTVLPGLIGGQVFLHASMAGLRMAAPLCILRAGLGAYAVGPLLALFAGAPIVFALPAGRLADRYGYRVPVRLAVALTSLGGLSSLASMYAGTLQYALLCLAATLAGAGANIGMITIQRTAGRTANNSTELKRVFSWLGIAPSISNFVGPLSAGLMIDHVGFTAAFALLSGLPVLSLLSAPLVPRESNPTQTADTSSSKRPATWDLLQIPMMRRLLLISWSMSASWDVHSFVVPVLGHARGLSASAIGSVLGLFALAVTAIRLAIPVLAHRLREVTVLTGALVLVATVFVIYPFADTVFEMSACAIILGFALGCSQPMVMTWLHQMTPAPRHGEAIALRSMTSNLSSALLPLGFSALGSALGASSLFWIMATFVVGGVFVARSMR